MPAIKIIGWRNVLSYWKKIVAGDVAFGVAEPTLERIARDQPGGPMGNEREGGEHRVYHNGELVADDRRRRRTVRRGLARGKGER